MDELAGRVGLSASRFHRVFSQWAGVTPKDFLQSLTHDYAKERLRSGSSVLDAALEAGLSGPGRLHDLCIGLEAATPGEIKSGGSGWTIVYGYTDSPFGEAFVAEGPRGICNVNFVDGEEPGEVEQSVQADWSAATFRRDDERAAGLASRIFADGAGVETGQRLKACVKGTDFQLKVWRALMRIPEGVLSSYGRVAETLGSASGARAVGTAVGQNPLAYLVPCHRVIRESGELGGFRWGLTRKRAMIGREAGALGLHT